MAELKGQRIWVAGHAGLVGSALVRALQADGIDPLRVDRASLDLRDQAAVSMWMDDAAPDMIVIAAAKVGGIGANLAAPADFMSDNLAIANNIVTHAARRRVKKLVFLGSSCIYPRMALQPIKEDTLLSAPLEPSNEAYALAKIAGLKLCQYYRRQYGHDFISVMPCNLYGPGDRWDDPGAHVIPGLMHRFHLAKLEGRPSVTVWGSGTPLREFLYSDDLAAAVILALRNYSDERPLNIGSGDEVTISALAHLIARVVGYEGMIAFDKGQPDGTPRKVLDSSRIRALGWSPQISLQAGLELSYSDYMSTRSSPDRISASSR